MSGSSLVSDLRAAREAKGLSLDDIQSETRIPVHILKQFEDGRLVGDPTYNAVYLKAFLKSYAKSVGLPQADVLAAYEASQGLRAAPAAPPSALPPPVAPVADEPAPAPLPTAPSQPFPDSVPSETAPSETVPTASAPAASALASAAGSRPAVSTGGRVNRPPVPSARRSFDKNWGTIIGLFIAVVGALAVALYFLVLRGDDDDALREPVATSTGDVTAIDSAGVGAGSASAAPQLQTPIRVTVYAGGNGLQNLRVTAEPDERRGYWIERGKSQTFESDQAVVLWGEDGDWSSGDAIVELQGQRWTPSGAVPLRIDAAGGQQLLDSLAARPAGAMPALPGALAEGETAE